MECAEGEAAGVAGYPRRSFENGAVSQGKRHVGYEHRAVGVNDLIELDPVINQERHCAMDLDGIEERNRWKQA